MQCDTHLTCLTFIKTALDSATVGVAGEVGVAGLLVPGHAFAAVSTPRPPFLAPIPPVASPLSIISPLPSGLGWPLQPPQGWQILPRPTCAASPALLQALQQAADPSSVQPPTGNDVLHTVARILFPSTDATDLLRAIRVLTSVPLPLPAAPSCALLSRKQRDPDWENRIEAVAAAASGQGWMHATHAQFGPQRQTLLAQTAHNQVSVPETPLLQVRSEDYVCFLVSFQFELHFQHTFESCTLHNRPLHYMGSFGPPLCLLQEACETTATHPIVK